MIRPNKNQLIRSVALCSAITFLPGCNSDQSHEPRVGVVAPPVAEESATAKQIENHLLDSEDIAISTLDIANPHRIELLIPHKTFEVDPETNAVKLTFDDLNLLNVLNMKSVTEDAVSKMPDWMTSLNGKTVRICGYMYPTFEVEGIEQFVMMKSNQMMNYGAPQQVYDFIMVTMRKGSTTDYVRQTSTLDVVGRFQIELLSEKGQIYQLFAVEDASVIKNQ